MTIFPKSKNEVRNGVEKSLIYTNDIDNSYGIVISNATAKWIKNQTVNTIEDINLIVKPDELIAIIGHVGAGKVQI